MNALAEHQQALLATLESAANQHGGALPFHEFMNIALYAPGLGYYSAGLAKFGAEGDFVTAPEISPLFSQCLGNQCIQILKTLDTKPTAILELGAGTGRMAADVLTYLLKKNALPEKYYILEVSGDLKSRQQALLQQSLPEYINNIEWISDLNTLSFKGIILANEIIDAMPVSLFKIGNEGEVLEGFVKHTDQAWGIEYLPPTSPHLTEAVTALQSNLTEPLLPGYSSEILLSLTPWLQALERVLKQGVMIFIDYGFPRHEYYHPSRHMGTLMCHTRHKTHSDPMQLIGLQDITAHVDFTALALAAKQCNLKIAGFTTQATFLLSNHLLGLMEDNSSDDIKRSIQLSQQIQMLTAPHEMGELFKVMALSKGIDNPIQGFQLRDHRHRL